MFLAILQYKNIHRSMERCYVHNQMLKWQKIGNVTRCKHEYLKDYLDTFYLERSSYRLQSINHTVLSTLFRVIRSAQMNPLTFLVNELATTKVQRINNPYTSQRSLLQFCFWIKINWRVKIYFSYPSMTHKTLIGQGSLILKRDLV